MTTFTEKHHTKITATLSCFDRIIFHGHLPLQYPGAIDRLLSNFQVAIKDFKTFAPEQAERLKQHAVAVAEQQGRPYMYIEDRHTRKDDLAREIAERDTVTDGLVCVVSVVEPCTTFKIAYGAGRPTLRRARRKCLHLYYYFMDRELGLIHVRLQTWFPFTIQVYANGHEWLARRMDRAGIGYKQADNAFVKLDDPDRAQRLSDKFLDRPWRVIFDKYAQQVNPLLTTLLSPKQYYWVVDQAEYATDVLFTDCQALRALYPRLLQHALLCFGASDVLTFLGRKLTGNFKGEVVTTYTTRWPGARVKHRMKANWIKMYDKLGRVLRVETVINRPYEFKVRRMATRKGAREMAWCPMAKNIANLYRYADVSRRANHRYLDALTVVDDPSLAQAAALDLVKPVTVNQRSVRGLNPLAPRDAAVVQAVMQGEHVALGFRNRDVRDQLFRCSKNPDINRRNSAQTTRFFKVLHAHGLIAKVPRSRKWRITRQGHAAMSAAIRVRKEVFPNAFLSCVA